MILCRKTWSWAIDKVEIEERSFLIWPDLAEPYTGLRWDVLHKHRDPWMKDYFLPFPVEQFPEAHQQEALLNHGRCQDALFIMDDLVQELLKGMDFKITEVAVRVKDPVMMLVHVRPDGTRSSISSQHHVFKITLANQESLVLDLSGAQYGWYGPTKMIWSKYLDERSKTILKVRDFGAMTGENLALADSYGPTGMTFPGVLGSVKKSVKDALSCWQRENLSFKNLLRCPENEFKSKQDQMLSHTEECVSREVAIANKMIKAAGWRPSMGTHA
ncbi:MAG: hypothetical protein Q9180_003914 [Flavoplaca navasiana]